MTPPGTVATEIVDDPAPPPDFHIPGGAGRPYNPRQRESLDEEPLERPGSPAVAAARAAGRPRRTGRRHAGGGGALDDPDRAPGGDLLAGDLPPEAPGRGADRRIGHVHRPDGHAGRPLDERPDRTAPVPLLGRRQLDRERLRRRRRVAGPGHRLTGGRRQAGGPGAVADATNRRRAGAVASQPMDSACSTIVATHDSDVARLVSTTRSYATPAWTTSSWVSN